MKSSVSNLAESFSRRLQDEAMQEIDRRGMDATELAEILDLFPEGARRILSQEEWSAARGLRVLGALGLSIDVTIVSKEA